MASKSAKPDSIPSTHDTPGPPGSNGGKTRRFLRHPLPRIETLLLLLSFVCVMLGKAIVLREDVAPGGFLLLVQVILPDIVFFTAMFLLYQGLYEWKASAGMARFILILSFVIGIWSVLNMGWLLVNGKDQFKPDQVKDFFVNISVAWPLVKTHLKNQVVLTIAICALLSVIIALFVGKMIRPNPVQPSWILRSRRIVISMGVIMVALLLQPALRSVSNLGLTGEFLAFNSQWHALVSIFNSSDQIQTRNIFYAGQRNVTYSKTNREPLPNVVLVLWESISYSSTTLADPKLDTTPFLKKLAQQGVEMRQTRALVSHTSKAFWSILTGTTPVIQQDYVEAVPMNTCYESLPTLLARIGYRSAFFEMSMGSYECAPGMFHNLGFDWAWFRENLQDESAHLGYMAGDDFRMIDPALEWAKQETKPFLLTFMTSISHDPFEVPKWYGQNKEDRYQNYLQTLRCSDEFLKTLCQKLREQGLYDNTILCVLGDHGTNLHAWVGGRVMPYEELIRIPWVITWPGHLASQKPIEWPCSQLDVTPTLLKLIGFDISRAKFEGKDAFTRSPLDRRSYFSAWYAHSPLGFVEGQRKFIYLPYQDMVFVCDLEKDPQEKNYTAIPAHQAEPYKQDILDWQKHSQIVLDQKLSAKEILYQHWHWFNIGRSAWAYYVP